jgi:serine/threonine protein kinase
MGLRVKLLLVNMTANESRKECLNSGVIPSANALYLPLMDGDLSSLTPRSIPETVARQWVADLWETLVMSHKADVVHLDLTTENILYRVDGESGSIQLHFAGYLGRAGDRSSLAEITLEVIGPLPAFADLASYLKEVTEWSDTETARNEIFKRIGRSIPLSSSFAASSNQKHMAQVR